MIFLNFILDAFKEKVMADEYSRRVTVKKGGRGNNRFRVDRRNDRRYNDHDDPGPDFYIVEISSV